MALKGIHSQDDAGDDAQWRRALAFYRADCQPTYVESLGAAGGFSGARFWRLSTPCGLLCLRRWPSEEPDAARLTFIHAVLALSAEHGFRRAPLPIHAAGGGSFIACGGHLWELAPWLDGRADYFPDRRPQKLQAALSALADWHLATADFPTGRPRRGSSPNVAARLAQIAELIAGGCGALLDQVAASPLARSGPWAELAGMAPRFLSAFAAVAPPVRDGLRLASSLELPLQPCIRDIWHDHVLFVGDEVSGLIDFGGMRIDFVATDVARLLGSLSQDDPRDWQMGIAAYQTARGVLSRPLSSDELATAVALSRSEAALSGFAWLRWVFLQQRRFSDASAVLARVRAILARLERLESAI